MHIKFQKIHPTYFYVYYIFDQWDSQVNIDLDYHIEAKVRHLQE